MITLYLVRHCSYDKSRTILPGRLPIPLSIKGKKEAYKLRRFFSDKKISKIFSSAVLRCQQTSKIISAGKIPIIYDQRLLECFSAYQGYWKVEWRHFFGHRQELGGESHQDVQNRMIDFYKKTKFTSNKNYIICSHGDPLYFFYQYLTKQPLLKENKLNEEPLTPSDYQSTGSILKINIYSKEKIEVQPLIIQEQLV